jgi:phage shock protein A
MATKKSTTTKPSASRSRPAPKKKATTKAAPKREAKPKAPPVPPKPRHPRARVVENHGSKEALARSLAAVIARADQDTDQLEASLKRASNAQLLRLSRASAVVKEKYGDREKLIAAIGAAQKKSADKDYLARLDKYSLPQLLDLATSSARRAAALVKAAAPARG